jgi:hypothetical protein
MQSMASNLIRWAGLAAVAGGALFIGIQAIHPPDELASVTTGMWAITHYLSMAMCLLILAGLAGLHARQTEESGRLGLAGYLVFGSFWALASAFDFAEAVILPLVAADDPRFVEGWLGMVRGGPISGAGPGMDLGALGVAWNLGGMLYLFGALLLGVAMMRAGVLSRWGAGLLAGGAIAGPAMSLLLPHTLARSAALPTGLALIVLGYALWSERRQDTAAATPGVPSLQFSQTGAR